MKLRDFWMTQMTLSHLLNQMNVDIYYCEQEKGILNERDSNLEARVGVSRVAGGAAHESSQY